MRVIDATGAEVGTVTAVRSGDPNAVVAQEPSDGDGVLAGKVPHTEEGDEPAVPADLAARLLRTGYLRLTGDRSGPDCYVEADQISEVTADAVRLAVPGTTLAVGTA
ncbi:hypothetical protein [Micromonospora zhanjiangensis]